MKKLGLLAATTFLTAAALVTPIDSEVPHFALQKSSPEAEATVTHVAEIRLWFSQVPQENSVSVRLVDAAGEAVPTGDLQSDSADGRIVFTPVSATLADGAYTVAWRGIGDDGHVVRGDFPFTVSAQR